MHDNLKKVMKASKQPKLRASDYVSTGSTMLNLGCTGHPDRGLIKGYYYFYVGDSNSGKTFLTLTGLAEAAHNPNFDDYRLIFDDAEHGALMNWAKFFGKKTAARIEPPAKSEDGEWRSSSTIEEFYYHLDDARKVGKPVYYILDSMDAVSSNEEGNKLQEDKAAHRKGKAATGSYGMAKAKRNSSGIRQTIQWLRESKSILVIISQTRQRIGFGAQFDPRTRAGGTALTFYAGLEMWSQMVGHTKKLVNGKDRETGIKAQVRIKKNRIQGKDRTVIVPISHSTGIDDVGSCIDFLIEEKRLRKAVKGGKIDANEDIGMSGSREQLVQFIEENDLEDVLKAVVKEVWDDIESKSALKRKRRYE